MKKAVLCLALLAFAAVPAFAQSSQQFGFLAGGSKRINDFPDSQGNSTINDFEFSNSVKEAFYGIELEPGTMLKIKVGQITAPIATVDAEGNTIDVGKGNLNHVDALIDYRFSEPWGSTGLFGGIGLYKQSPTGYEDEANFGFSAGVNGDFPLSRRYGLLAEIAYHWVRLEARPRYLTLTGGLRIAF